MTAYMYIDGIFVLTSIFNTYKYYVKNLQLHNFFLDKYALPVSRIVIVIYGTHIYCRIIFIHWGQCLWVAIIFLVNGYLILLVV